MFFYLSLTRRTVGIIEKWVIDSTTSAKIRLRDGHYYHGTILVQSTGNDVSMRHGSQRESWTYFSLDFAKPCF